jgi:hypothetical protein
VKEPTNKHKQFRMQKGAWSEATPKEKSWPSSVYYPYTGCPIFFLAHAAHGHVKEWCQQGQEGRGVKHDGGHH